MIHKISNFAEKELTMELQERYKAEAVELGLCKQWTDDWGTPNDSQLIDKFIRGLDFCIKHNWPSVTDIKENFNDSFLKSKGVYVSNGQSSNQEDVIVMGDAVVLVNADSPCDLTVRHNGTVMVNVSSGLCYISAYDNCRVIIKHKDPMAKIVMSYYGGSIEGKEFINKINIKTR